MISRSNLENQMNKAISNMSMTSDSERYKNYAIALKCLAETYKICEEMRVI